MAADQRKKRVNASSSLTDCTSRDQYRVKRKRLEEPLHHNLKMKPNISLEWDSEKNGVVSRRDQIGISRRHSIPLIGPVYHGHNILADVFSVPQGIFQFENLSDVLPYEVWQSHLSEKERRFLSQFLPKGTDPDTVVGDLLDGNNFHFGNPFLDWGTSLCSGELHPDNVLHKEQSLKACKKAYHLNLQNYHNDMIENLETWKEKWVSCNDPEADIVQKMWRLRKHARKSLPPPETRFYDTEENNVATPESANSEKAESQKRKRLLNKKSDSSSSGLKVVAIPKQGEKVHKRNIQSEDGAKYMSYIKVSKEQHEQVKSSMKHTGNSIQPRSLNNVLGSFDAFNVQPFERFEEEERNNLHNYWLKLANRDIPEYFAAWKKRQLQRQQLTWSLSEEIKEKLEQVEVTEDKEKECSEDNVMEPSSEDDSVEEILPVVSNEELDKEQQSVSLLEEDQMDDGEAIHEMTTEVKDDKEKESDYIFEDHTHDDSEVIGEDDVTVRGRVLLQDCNEQQQQQIASSLNDSPSRVSDMIKPPPKSIFLKGVQHQQQIPPRLLTNNPQVINSMEMQQQIASLDSSPRVSAMTETPKPIFLQDQHQQRSPCQVVNSVEMQSHYSSASAKTEADPPIVSEYLNHPGNVDISVSQGQGSDVWAAAGGDCHHGSYYQSSSSSSSAAAANDGYAASTQELSLLGHPQLFIQEQQQKPVQNQMLDLESNRHYSNNKDDVVQRESHDMSFFNSYSTATTQDRSELLQSLIKGGQNNNMPYHLRAQNEQNQLGLLHLQPGSDVMMEEVGQFAIPRHHHHQSLALDVLTHKRLNDVLYLQQQQQHQSSIQDSSSMYTSIQAPTRQEHQLAVNDWATPSSQSQSSLNNNWFMVQNNNNSSGGGREGWAASSFEGAVGRDNNSDQSLYSVLSECNELRSAAGGGTRSYDSMGSTERFIQAQAAGQSLGGGNNYSSSSRIGMGIPIPSISSGSTNYNNSMLQQVAPNHHPLQYLSGHHEPVATSGRSGGGLKMNNNNLLGLGGSWMSLPLPHPQLQNPPAERRIQDSMATKPPFLRSSWNQ